MSFKDKLLLTALAVVTATGMIVAFVLGSVGGRVVCRDAEASYFPLAEPAGTFAYATAIDTTVVTTAGTYYEIMNPFDNSATENFTVLAGPPAGIRYDGETTRYFEVDWHADISGDANGITAHCGIAINGTTPETSSIMGTFMKTANEVQALSGTTVIQLDTDDVVTLVLTADGDLDEVTVTHFTTSIRPFFVRE